MVRRKGRVRATGINLSELLYSISLPRIAELAKGFPGICRVSAKRIETY